MSEVEDRVVQQGVETDFTHKALGVVGNSLIFSGGVVLDAICANALYEAVPAGNVVKSAAAIGGLVFGSLSVGFTLRNVLPIKPSRIFREEHIEAEELPDFTTMTGSERAAWVIANPPGSRSRKTD